MNHATTSTRNRWFDAHAHAFHPKIAEKAVEQLRCHYGITPSGTGLAGDLLTRLDAAGIGNAIVLCAATRPEQVPPANDFAIRLQTEEPRLKAFGAFHPDFPGWRCELDRLENAGIRGIKLHPDFQGFRLDDSALHPFLDAAEGRFALMIHVGDRKPPNENPSCPAKVALIARRHPRMKIVAAHFGGFMHWDQVVPELADSNVFLDTSSSLDFLDDDTLQRILDVFGLDRILFGSDYPLFDPVDSAAQVARRLKLDSKALDQIMTNTWRLFD